MKHQTQMLLIKADRAILAAKVLLAAGDLNDFSTGRAYYGMFYAAEALLEELDLRFSKHGGVLGAFGKHYVQTGIFDAKYHRWLLNAYDQRIEGDYDIEIIAAPDDAKDLIIKAEEFLIKVKEYLSAK